MEQVTKEKKTSQSLYVQIHKQNERTQRLGKITASSLCGRHYEPKHMKDSYMAARKSTDSYFA